MACKKSVMFLGFLLTASVSLGACSSGKADSTETDFHTLAQESISDPQYLPVDLPIPEGAGITYTEGKLIDGKRTSMLIYETDKSMTRLGSAYMKYVREKALENGTQIVDQNNLIISGKAPGSYSYSIIGSSSAAASGGSEIIVTWIEN